MGSPPGNASRWADESAVGTVKLTSAFNPWLIPIHPLTWAQNHRGRSSIEDHSTFGHGFWEKDSA